MPRGKQDRNQPRRWSVDRQLAKSARMTENSVTPEEARTALIAILEDVGIDMEQVLEYCPNKDLFTCQGYRVDNRKLTEAEVPGESVALVVKAARTMATKGKPLKRWSELGLRQPNF